MRKRLWLVSAACVAGAAWPAWAQGTTTPGFEAQRDWKDTVTLVGAVVGAVLGVLNLSLGIWREKQKRGADGAYLAMRLAIILEAYASACSDLIYANHIAERRHDQQYPDWDIKLPKMPAFPEDDTGWKTINPNTASECLGFGNEIASSQDTVSQVLDYDEDNLEHAVRREASARGLQAWNLAVELRRSHGLKAIQPEADYAGHLERVMEEEEARLAAERAHRDARAAERRAHAT